MQQFVFALALIGIVDAISFMVVSPSLVFYVLQNGGTKEQYGLILSSYSFASFCCKPVMGAWSDSHGFRFPYVISQSLSTLGGALYLFASAVENGAPSVYTVLAGRLLGGVGAANSTLGFIYVARVLPHDEQTKLNSLLSTARILGMFLGPALNYVVQFVDFSVGSFHFDELNSVGLILVICNLLSMLFVYLYLEEPPSEKAAKHLKVGSDDEGEETDHFSTMDLVRAILSPDILVYLFSIFSFNASFQLIETSFAPAANDALGWGPFEVSVVMGLISVVIAANMMLVFRLSSQKVRDESLLVFGLLLGAFGYGLVYFCWRRDVPSWSFYLPIIVGASSFPYLGAPTRSLFTKAVDAKHVLDPHHGKMQALLSMGASVAGFVAPGLIATYVLRSPTEVETSADQRELSSGALFAPLLSLLVLLGHLMVVRSKQSQSQKVDGKNVTDEGNPDENTALVFNNNGSTVADDRASAVPRLRRRASQEDIHIRKFHHEVSHHRHSSCSMMGMSQTHLHGEENMNSELEI